MQGKPASGGISNFGSEIVVGVEEAGLRLRCIVAEVEVLCVLHWPLTAVHWMTPTIEM